MPAGLGFNLSSHPPPLGYRIYHLTNREQKGMIAVTVKVFYLYGAPTGRLDNSRAGGNSVALCCIRLIYIGNTLSLCLSPSLPHTL